MENIHNQIKKELSDKFGFSVDRIINRDVAYNDLMSQEINLECGVRVRERQYHDLQYYQIIN